jgi:hypothetical protein
MRSICRWIAAGAGMAAGAFATYAAVTWLRYGDAGPSADPDEHDPLLDRLMPRYDIVERHHIGVAAPADAVLAAAREVDLQGSWIARAIFRAREILLGAEPDAGGRPHGLVAETTSLGWRVLAEEPGRELVVGAVTRPWEANVTFEGLAPEAFAAFDDPGYVKIAWTLRADPVDGAHTIFRTETRALATDASARARFRRYWACLSPGIILIRLVLLRPVKHAAEQQAPGIR